MGELLEIREESRSIQRLCLDHQLVVDLFIVPSRVKNGKSAGESGTHASSQTLVWSFWSVWIGLKSQVCAPCLRRIWHPGLSSSLQEASGGRVILEATSSLARANLICSCSPKASNAQLVDSLQA